MESFSVTAVQMNALKGDLEHNLQVHRRFAVEAAGRGCRLVLFPELSTTSHYGDAEAASLAQPADGSIFQFIRSLAAELNIVISYGFCQFDRGTCYNTQALVGPAGLIGLQSKTHASRDEYFFFRMGRSLEVFDLGFARVGTLICYDSDFFEAWRVLALKGAEVILLPHASRIGGPQPVPEEQQLSKLTGRLAELPDKRGVYAADNNVFTVFANQAGYNGHSTHQGGAYVLGPDGKVIEKSQPVLNDLCIYAQLDPQARLKRRDSVHSTLKMRRPEIYGDVTEMR